MKHLLLTLILIPTLLSAQELNGKIVYEESIQFKFNFGGDMDDDIITNLPSSKKDYSELLFTDGQSLFRATEGPQEAVDEKGMSFTTDGGAEIEIVTKKSTNETYHNIHDKILIQKIDFMSRTFLITDDLSTIAWKLNGDTKKILGYTCSRATYTKDSTEHEAWYTTEIPLPLGPSSFVGLPGVILELSVNDGERVYKAMEVTLDEDFSEEITPPKKGKKVTKAEFELIKKEKMEELELEYGQPHGSGGVKVFIQKN